MKVVGYTRTSWNEQVQATYPGIVEQERALRAFVKRTGLVLSRVYADNGLANDRSTFAGLVSILDSMDEDWECVLVTSLDRIRGNRVSFDAVRELSHGGKGVLVANEETAQRVAEAARVAPRIKAPPADGSTDGERRRKIAERLLRGREAGARAGKHQSGPAPYGYRRDYSLRGTNGVRLVPDEEESAVVRLIFREYLRLRSMKRLIKLLDDHGLRTRRGKRWSRAGISWILKNDTYVGRVHFGAIHTKGRHQSIVAPILFNKVQKLIRLNNRRARNGHDDDDPDGPVQTGTVARGVYAREESEAVAG